MEAVHASYPECRLRILLDPKTKLADLQAVLSTKLGKLFYRFVWIRLTSCLAKELSKDYPYVDMDFGPTVPQVLVTDGNPSYGVDSPEGLSISQYVFALILF